MTVRELMHTVCWIRRLRRAYKLIRLTLVGSASSFFRPCNLQSMPERSKVGFEDDAPLIAQGTCESLDIGRAEQFDERQMSSTTPLDDSQLRLRLQPWELG